MTDLRELPPAMSATFGTGDLESLRDWWSGLPADHRTELVRLWDARSEDVAWSASGEAVLAWEALPIELHGRTVSDPELAADRKRMRRDLLEFVLNHEEVQFFLADRRFHICRQHAQARQVLAEGLLPVRFRCSLRGERCPMRAISKAAGEEAVLIELRVGRAPRAG